MKQLEMARWLKIIDGISLVCCIVLAFAVVPLLGYDMMSRYPDIAGMFWPCLIFIWLSVVPLIVIGIISWQIFIQIGRDESFCHENAARLKTISYLASIDVVAYLLASVALALMSLLPISVLLVALVVMMGSLLLAVTSATLSHLTEKAAALKAENDLTV
jgi:hypothetical protein